MPELTETKRKSADRDDEILDTLKLIATALATRQETPHARTDKFDKLLGILEEETTEKLERKRKEIEDMKEMAKRNAEAAAEGMKLKKLEQHACNHRMPNQHPAVSGQRLSNGVLFMVCCKCQKEWYDFKDNDDREIPQEIIPDGVRLGLGTGF